jgi:hypothetical protein
LKGLFALSLPLFIATAVIWVRSYFVADLITASSATSGDKAAVRAVYSIKGVIVFYEFPASRLPNDRLGYSWVRSPPAQMPAQRGYFPFGLTIGHGYGLTRWTVRISYWLLAAIASAIPILRFFQMRRAKLRQRRIAHGLCGSCGYDLRASPDCCPECGTPSPQPAAR